MLGIDDKVVLRIYGRSYRNKDIDYIVQQFAEKEGFEVHHYNWDFGKFSIKVCGIQNDEVIFREIGFIELNDFDLERDIVIESDDAVFYDEDLDLWATEYVNKYVLGDFEKVDHNDKSLVIHYTPFKINSISKISFNVDSDFLKKLDLWLFETINCSYTDKTMNISMFDSVAGITVSLMK